MAGLNKPRKPLFKGEERYSVALKFINRLFPDFPDYNDFSIMGEVRKAKWQGDDLTGASELQMIMQELLVDKLFFAEISKRSNAQIVLTKLGRDEKKRRLENVEEHILIASEDNLYVEKSPREIILGDFKYELFDFLYQSFPSEGNISPLIHSFIERFGKSRMYIRNILDELVEGKFIGIDPNYRFSLAVSQGGEYNDKHIAASLLPTGREELIRLQSQFQPVVTNSASPIGHDSLKDHKNTSSDSAQSGGNITYDFPTITSLTEVERQYLNILYRNFLTGKTPSGNYSIKEIWTDFPEFKPETMSQLLVGSGSELTLWGIWHIDPQSKFFELFDNVVYAIRIILLDNLELKTVSSEQIQEHFYGITNVEIGQIFQLMQSFHTFYKGYGRTADLNYFINLEDNQVLEQYRSYPGLQIFLTRFLQSQGLDLNLGGNEVTPEELPGSIAIPADLNKTDVIRRLRDEFAPVMGVTELAEDMAQIIHDLPPEKGQMIGIFGKWGRGKTYLLGKLWEVLSKKGEDKLEYIRVEYHAWKYQETPASWAYLYELLAEKYLGNKKGYQYFNYQWRLIRLNWVRLGWLPFATLLGTFLSGILIAWIANSKLHNQYPIAISATLATVLIGVLKKSKKEFSTEASALVKKYTLRQSYKPTMGIQAAIQEEMVKLLKVWVPVSPKTTSKEDNQQIAATSKIGKKKKILLVVEDVDRCTEEKIIQNIDALRVMLEDEEIAQRLLVVTAIDERILKNAIRIKYQSIVKLDHQNKKRGPEQETTDNDTSGAISMNTLVSEYMDKVFITAVKLGELSETQKGEYLLELLKNDLNEVKWAAFYDNPDGQTSPTYIDHTDDSEIPMATSPSATVQIEAFLQSDNPTDDEPRQEKVLVSVEKLSIQEAQLLRQLIESWADATPRRISIFYYRYILTKNLLLSKYSTGIQLGVWRNRESIWGMMHLILHYSNTYEPERIHRDKNEIAKLDNWEKVEFPHTHVSISKMDYLVLLEVLELTIAY
jgi:hypothetical protein